MGSTQDLNLIDCSTGKQQDELYLIIKVTDEYN